VEAAFLLVAVDDLAAIVVDFDGADGMPVEQPAGEESAADA
jgi:hypothetical protein|tara:strand:- start:7450 stop:7572 length:123 start_codon:yes stop_codon:yes gene_type:complete